MDLVMRCATAALLLRDRDRDPLAALGAPATEHLAPPARLLTGAKSMGALAALVVRLVGTLHGTVLGCLRNADRYSTTTCLSTTPTHVARRDENAFGRCATPFAPDCAAFRTRECRCHRRRSHVTVCFHDF